MDIKCVHQTSSLRSALTKWLHNLISSPWTFKVGEIAPEISTLIEVLFPNLNYMLTNLFAITTIFPSA